MQNPSHTPAAARKQQHSLAGLQQAECRARARPDCAEALKGGPERAMPVRLMRQASHLRATLVRTYSRGAAPWKTVASNPVRITCLQFHPTCAAVICTGRCDAPSNHHNTAQHAPRRGHNCLQESSGPWNIKCYKQCQQASTAKSALTPQGAKRAYASPVGCPNQEQLVLVQQKALRTGLGKQILVLQAGAP